MTIRALIVDDEPLARERIREMLRAEADVEIVGECDGGTQAITSIRDVRPDLVFLDVQMPEVDGFDVLRQIPRAELPAVVFVTAHEEHAIRAFDVHALDYVLKPFREDRFREALGRARKFLAGSPSEQLGESIHALLETLRPSGPAGDRLVIRSPGRVLFVPFDEVDWFEAAGNYVLVHTGAKSHLLRETMTDLDDRLDSRRFRRIHRSTIVNLERVAEVRSLHGGDARIVLRDGTELALSRRYRRRFEEGIGG